MKRSLDTGGLRRQLGDFEAIRVIAEAGFECVSYDFHEAALREDYREYAEKIRECLGKCGVTCNQAHAPYEMTVDDPFDPAEAPYNRMLRALEAASVIGAQNVVAHAIDVSPRKREVDFEAHNLNYFRSLEPWCEKFGVRVAIENLYRWNPKTRAYLKMLSTPAELLSMLG